MTPQAGAKLAVSLNRISGGRAAINIVNSWWKEEFETFGHGWQPQHDDARYRRMDEFVRVLRGLWQEDVFDFTASATQSIGKVYRSNPFNCRTRRSMPERATRWARRPSPAMAIIGLSTTGCGSATSSKRGLHR
jgi:hypothetical protein